MKNFHEKFIYETFFKEKIGKEVKSKERIIFLPSRQFFYL